MNNLFSSGFHFAEIIPFLKRSKLLEDRYANQMQDGLAEGKSFSAIMSSLGFSDNVVTQLSLAELHGNLELSLVKIEEYLEKIRQVRKKLVEVATYPFILLGFLVFIMLGLKNYLLPQLETQNMASQLIVHLPTIFLGSLCVFGMVATFLIFYGRKCRKILLYSQLARLPFLGNFIKSYLTAYYAREWGTMIGQGLELSQIFHLMQGQASQLFQEIGVELEKALFNGQEFSQTIQTYPFFRQELSLIIEYGEVKDKLGKELEVYAEKTWDTFFSQVNRAMALIQPVVFLFVALLIVLLYAAMLLPIYQSMEVHI